MFFWKKKKIINEDQQKDEVETNDKLDKEKEEIVVEEIIVQENIESSNFVENKKPTSNKEVKKSTKNKSSSKKATAKKATAKKSTTKKAPAKKSKNLKDDRRNIYYVSPRKDNKGKKIGWDIKIEGAKKVTSICKTKEEAVSKVKKLTSAKGSTIIIKKADGSHQETIKI